jgi:hypothetical protein
LKLSALSRPIDILGGPKEDAYALTHLVIYCTNFGFSAKRLPRPKSEVLAEARSLLAKCLDEEDYDLAAETLMIWPQLGVPFCASSAFGFWVLLQVESQVGVLPSVRTRSDRLKRLKGDDRTRYAFATAYHTALVMGLLCAAIEQNNDDFLGWMGAQGEIGDQPISAAGAAGNLSLVFQEILLSMGGGRAPVQFLYSNAVHGGEGPIDQPNPPAQK